MEHVFLEEFDVVLAYSRRDKRLLRRLEDDLGQAGIATWSGAHLKPESDFWAGSLQKALRQARALVVLLTPNARHAPEVQQAVVLARQAGRKVYPLLLAGNIDSAQPEALSSVAWLDLRNEVQFNKSLAVPALITQLQGADEPPRLKLRPWNPLDQLRLLWILFRSPGRVAEYQDQLGTPTLRQTAGWLAASLVYLLLLIRGVDSVLGETQWWYLVGLGLGLGWCVLAGLWTRARAGWIYYGTSMGIAVVLTVVTLPLVLAFGVDELRDVPPLRLGVWALLLSAPLVGAFSLGLAETFQARGILVTSVALLDSVLAALSVALLAAPAVAAGVSSEVGAIAALTLLGVTVGALTILILYGLTFLIANDLIQAVYLRGQHSALGRAMPAVLIGSYVVMLLAGLVSL